MVEFSVGQELKTSSDTLFKKRDNAEARQEALKARGILTKVLAKEEDGEEGFILKVVQVESEESRENNPGRTRLPIGERDVLTVPKKKGFVRRWVMDKVEDGPRIKRFEAAGYELVRESIRVGDQKAGDANPLGSPVCTPARGFTNAWLYLMEIPEEWYEEDQRLKQEKIDQEEAKMRHRGGSEQEALRSKNREYGRIDIRR